MVKARQLNSYLSLNDLNATEPNPNYNSHYKSLPNLSSDASMTSADSTPLMQHPLCQTNSYYSDSTTDDNHDSNTIENSSTECSSSNTTEQQEFSGELEFAAAYTMELSQQQSNSSLTQTPEKSSHSYESSECDSRSNDSLCSSENSDSNISQNNTKSSTKSNVSADNNFNNLAAKKPPPGSHLHMLAAAASPSPATVQRRYRIQSCDIMETGSWIICDNLF